MIDKENAWIEGLMSPESRVNIELMGYQTLPPQWHMKRTIPSHFLWFVTDNECEGRVEKTRVRLESGSMLWLGPGIPHEFWTPPGMPPMKFYFLRFRVLRNLKDVTFSHKELLKKQAWELRPLIEQVYDGVHVPSRYQDSQRRALLTLLFIAVFDVNRTLKTGTILNKSQRLNLRNYLTGHIQDRPTSADLASELRLSRDYFSRMFYRTYGMSPRLWIKKERIQLAAETLTETNLNIGEVAQRFGYQDIFLFSRQFREVFGCTPTSYRKTH